MSEADAKRSKPVKKSSKASSAAVTEAGDVRKSSRSRPSPDADQLEKKAKKKSSSSSASPAKGEKAERRPSERVREEKSKSSERAEKSQRDKAHREPKERSKEKASSDKAQSHSKDKSHTKDKSHSKDKAHRKKVSATTTTRLRPNDLLNEDDLDAKLLDMGSGEIDVIEPNVDHSDELLLPEELGEDEVDINLDKKPKRESKKESKPESKGKKASDRIKGTPAKKSKSGRISAPVKAEPAAEVDSAQDEPEETGKASRKVSKKRATSSRPPQGKNPLMFIAIGAGILIIVLIIGIVIKLSTTKPGRNDQDELKSAQALYKQALDVVHEMRDAPEEQKDQLRSDAIDLLKQARSKFDGLLELDEYTELDEDGERVWKQKYSGLETQQKEIQTHLHTLGKDKKVD